jgi:hypothetical protein
VKNEVAFPPEGAVQAYAAAGVQHIMVHPQDREIDDWDTVIEGVGKIAAG